MQQTNFGAVGESFPSYTLSPPFAPKLVQGVDAKTLQG